jgi:hypothetical protein
MYRMPPGTDMLDGYLEVVVSKNGFVAFKAEKHERDAFIHDKPLA